MTWRHISSDVDGGPAMFWAKGWAAAYCTSQRAETAKAIPAMAAEPVAICRRGILRASISINNIKKPPAPPRTAACG